MKFKTIVCISFVIVSISINTGLLTEYNVNKTYSKEIFEPLGDWIIDGDMVYTEDENCYLSVTPYNLTGRGWVNYQLVNKRATQDIDIVYGFDIDTIKPKAIQIWKSHTRGFTGWHIVPINYNLSLSDVTGYDNLGMENYNEYEDVIGTENNSYLFRVYYDNKTDIVAFNSYWIDEYNYYHLNMELDVMQSYTYQDTITEWVDINKKPQIINYNYENMTKWFLFRNIPVVQNQEYKFRVWLEPQIHSGNYKYWYAIKPSSETLSDAINNGHLYALDPWGASFSSWGFRKQGWVQADQFVDAQTNFPVYINITDADIKDEAQNDGDDLVFTASDGETVLNHELVTYNSTNGHIIAWVNFTSIANGANTTFFLYYGNAGCAAQEDVPNTWHSQFKLIYHMNHSDTQISGCFDSTSNAFHGTYSGSLPTDAYVNGEQYGQYWDGNGDYVTFPAGMGSSAQKNGTFMWFWAHVDDSANHVPVRHFDADGSDRCPYSEIRYSDNKCYMAFKWNNLGSTDYEVRNPTTSDTHWYMRYETGDQDWGWNGNPVAAIGTLTSTAFTSVDRTIGATAAGTSSCLGNWYELWWSDQNLDIEYCNSCYNVLINSSTAVEWGIEEVYTPPVSNNRPELSNENPTNHTTDVDITVSWNITLSDDDADDFLNFTITCSNSQTSSKTNEVGGNKSLNITGLSYSHQYIVWVNVSDGEDWTNGTYYFITTGDSEEDKEIFLYMEDVEVGPDTPEDTTIGMGTSGNLEVHVMSFDPTAGGNDEEVFLKVHAPYDLDEDYNVEIHLIWFTHNWDGGTYEWKIDYLIKTEGDEYGGNYNVTTGTPTTINITVTPTDNNQFMESEIEEGIDWNTDELLFMRLYLDKGDSTATKDGHMVLVEVEYVNTTTTSSTSTSNASASGGPDNIGIAIFALVLSSIGIAALFAIKKEKNRRY